MFFLSSENCRGGSSLAMGFVKQSLQLLLAGGLLLLHQVSVALSDTPAVRFGHGGTQWTARGRFQLLPVIAASPAGIIFIKTTNKADPEGVFYEGGRR